MIATVWEMLCHTSLITGSSDRIIIEKFSEATTSDKLYEVAFTAGEFELHRDRVLLPEDVARRDRLLHIRGTGSKELQDHVLKALRDKKGCRTVISRVCSESPRRKVGQLFVDSRGLVHRDPDEGPAYWYQKCGDSHKYYIWHGLFHRVGEPAVIITEDRRLREYVWFRHGRFHRPLADGPSETEKNNPLAPSKTERRYYMHGHRYQTPQEGGQRLHTDEHINEKCEGRFPRAYGERRQEAAVSWLRQKYRMREPEMQGVHLPDPPTRPERPKMPFGEGPSVKWLFAPD